METMEAVRVERKVIKSDRETEELYESAFPLVARFVKNLGGTFDDAKDIFHDALIAYFELKGKDYSSRNAYVLGIAKHLWIRKYNRSRSSVPLSDMEKQIQLPQDFFPTVNTRRLVRFLEKAGKKCMDLLRAFYYQKKPMKTLVETMGFSNEHSASAQKYKCLEKVREMIKEKLLAYDDFIE